MDGRRRPGEATGACLRSSRFFSFILLFFWRVFLVCAYHVVADPPPLFSLCLSPHPTARLEYFLSRITTRSRVVAPRGRCDGGLSVRDGWRGGEGKGEEGKRLVPGVGVRRELETAPSRSTRTSFRRPTVRPQLSTSFLRFHSTTRLFPFVSTPPPIQPGLTSLSDPSSLVQPGPVTLASRKPRKPRRAFAPTAHISLLLKGESECGNGDPPPCLLTGCVGAVQKQPCESSITILAKTHFWRARRNASRLEPVFFFGPLEVRVTACEGWIKRDSGADSLLSASVERRPTTEPSCAFCDPAPGRVESEILSSKARVPCDGLAGLPYLL